ncbi:hypothetical protein [Sphingomonas sp. 28-63-12]|uniref:hypothetical protein n=1 Tax=Sphingomonas sp. 28-63-12 TaxID=1970434 RepID=UPI0035A99405
MSSDDQFASARTARPSLRTALLFAGLAFVLGIGVTALFVRQYRQWLPPSARGMLDAGLGTGAATGDSAASAPGTGFQPPPEAGAATRSFDSDALDARQTAIAAQLATLEARTMTIDQEARAAAGNAGRAEALLIAFAARRALDRGLALGDIEAPLKRRFGGAQPRAVTTILASARAPVTLEDLRMALDAIAPELTSGVATDGWWTSLRREISSLIVIRHEGTPSPRATDRLARVRRLLDAGQVEAALAEVARLPGAPQAKAWMTAAGHYIEAHAALDTIETAAIIGQGMNMSVAATAPAGAAPPTATAAPRPVAEPATETTATATLTK